MLSNSNKPVKKRKQVKPVEEDVSYPLKDVAFEHCLVDWRELMQTSNNPSFAQKIRDKFSNHKTVTSKEINRLKKSCTQ